MQLLMLVVPPPTSALLGMLFLEVMVHGLKRAAGGDRLQRVGSHLHRRVRPLGRRFVRKLTRRKGLLLGQWGGGRRARLIGWSLLGSAITVAPPRTGKGALIALNLLSPECQGFDGSTVTIDPRGELWCISVSERSTWPRLASGCVQEAGRFNTLPCRSAFNLRGA